MSTIKRPVNEHQAYHAHIYFDKDSLEFARKLQAEAGHRFNVSPGRVHEKPVGPHPVWSCQLAFHAEQFDALIAWLDQNRDGLSVLVHEATT